MRSALASRPGLARTACRRLRAGVDFEPCCCYGRGRHGACRRVSCRKGWAFRRRGGSSAGARRDGGAFRFRRPVDRAILPFHLQGRPADLRTARGIGPAATGCTGAPPAWRYFIDGRLHEWGNPLALLRFPGDQPAVADPLRAARLRLGPPRALGRAGAADRAGMGHALGRPRRSIDRLWKPLLRAEISRICRQRVGGLDLDAGQAHRPLAQIHVRGATRLSRGRQPDLGGRALRGDTRPRRPPAPFGARLAGADARRTRHRRRDAARRDRRPMR